ncbi:hypothetical protein [Rhizobium sp. Root1220]|uniref:hypothetical protein n=1 Tax=Rhizobium sp. Root1220 TaxID=1736432 RepID=UPI0012E39CC1|nr:hypothetical protein [Rhizobium sp. Root1220]
MLRIQSLAFTSRSESTRTSHLFSKHQDPKASMPKTSVTSLDKRDRQSLFQRTNISADPANSAAHVSLSSHIQLSKNRPVSPVKTCPEAQSPKASNPHQHRSQSGNSEAKDIVASSAAALVQ